MSIGPPPAIAPRLADVLHGQDGNIRKVVSAWVAGLHVLLDDFPARPPIGIYVLHRQNAALIEQLSGRFNAFRDKAYHDAPPIRNFTWICYSYADNAWRYREDNPARGDNTAKFLAGFFAELSK